MKVEVKAVRKSSLHVITAHCLWMVAVVVLEACSSPPNVSSKVVVAPLPPPKTIGSLWQEENGRAYLYEDLRAMRIGDILTVKIAEDSIKGRNRPKRLSNESRRLTIVLPGARRVYRDAGTFVSAMKRNVKWELMRVPVINSTEKGPPVDEGH